jgi:aldehyde dehydrogenase (NAD+)
MIYKNYINGVWLDASKGNTFKNIDPAHTDKVISEFQDSDEVDINFAVEIAHNAFKFWKNTPAPKRGEIMFKAAAILERDKECIAKGMTQEMGKTLAETRGDVQEAIDMAYYAAGEGRRMAGEVVPSELENKWCMSKKEPIGVIGAITPWNFPIAIPSWKAFPALVAGNTMVIKPAEDTPWSVCKLAEVFHEAGLPAGVFNVVTGHGPTAGFPLITNPKVKMVSFTGSTATGNIVATTCASYMKPFSLEMGGKNGIVVMDDADIDLAVDGVVWGAFGTTGQRCTATSRVIVHESIHDEFMEKLVAKTETLKLGCGLNSETDVGPLINEKALRKVSGYVEDATQRGFRPLVGGYELKSPNEDVNGWFYQPTIFDNIDINDTLMQGEIFGPVVAVTSFSNTNEAIWMVNNTGYGLSSALYTQDVNLAFRFLNEAETGMVYVNASTIGAEIQLPFGGIKGTGNGHRDAGSSMIDNCTENKSCMIDFSGKVQKAQIDE